MARLASVGVASYHVLLARKSEFAGSGATDLALKTATEVFAEQLRRQPDNAMAAWGTSHVVRRQGQFAEAREHLSRVLEQAQAGGADAGLGGGACAYRIRHDYAQLLLINWELEDALKWLEPLLPESSRFTARCMALSWAAAAESTLGNEDRARAHYQVVMETGRTGRMDMVLARKAVVASGRTCRRIALFEMIYFTGFQGFMAKAPSVLRKLVDEVQPQVDVADANWRTAAAISRADPGGCSSNEIQECDRREELMAALLCQGSFMRVHVDIDDSEAETALRRVLELADKDMGAGKLTDPFHRPFAQYELGLLCLLAGRHEEGVHFFTEALAAPSGFCFDRVLAFRAVSPLEICKAALP